jgi:addiction module HigA family antidote
MTTETKASHRYEPEVVFPPGETLAERLEELGMTQVELAARTGLSAKHINQIVQGAAAVTPETALLLEHATRTPARVWNNLEIAYREYLTRAAESRRLTEDAPWLDELPIRQLVSRGWIKKCPTPVDQLREVCTFFGVADRTAWMTVWHKPTAYRTSKAFTSDPGAVAAWLRIGEIRAEEIECHPYDRGGLLRLLPQLREMTQERDPNAWFPALVSRCASVGVAVVAEPEIKGARINGAARWLTSTKALVQLSLRHKWSDIMWFTFFHEIGHVLEHSKKETFINDAGHHSGVEQEADAFASELLIGRQHEPELAMLRTLDDVRSFAVRIGVGPGIVVGRLQHDGRWPYNKGNELKQRLEFSGT